MRAFSVLSPELASARHRFAISSFSTSPASTARGGFSFARNQSSFLRENRLMPRSLFAAGPSQLSFAMPSLGRRGYASGTSPNEEVQIYRHHLNKGGLE